MGKKKYGLAPLITDPPPTNSITDTDTHPISHGLPNFVGRINNRRRFIARQNHLFASSLFTELAPRLIQSISLSVSIFVSHTSETTFPNVPPKGILLIFGFRKTGFFFGALQ